MAALFFLLLATLSPLLALLVVVLVIVSSRQYRLVKRLTREAQHDLLTGLPNRRGLALAWAAMDAPRALLFVDLDGFKAVNDRFGHAVGDALLRQVARRLEAAVPPPALLGRWGGDEFVAIVPAATVEAQRARFADAAVMAYDLSADGGPDAVRIGISAAATAADAGAEDFERAVGSASALLLRMRATRG